MTDHWQTLSGSEFIKRLAKSLNTFYLATCSLSKLNTAKKAIQVTQIITQLDSGISTGNNMYHK